MGRVGSIAVLALLIPACAPTIAERVHEYNDLGVQHFQKGEFDRAQADFQAGLNLVPNNAALLFNLAKCFENLGQSDPAEQYYRLCLRQQPNHVDCRHALNELLLQHGRPTEARQMTEDWLTNEPNLSSAYAEDGWLYQYQDNPIAAIKRYQQAVYYDPHNTRALAGMGQVYEEQLNQPSFALKMFQMALDYDPHQPDLVKRVKRLRAQGVGPPHPES